MIQNLVINLLSITYAVLAFLAMFSYIAAAIITLGMIVGLKNTLESILILLISGIIFSFGQAATAQWIFYLSEVL